MSQQTIRSDDFSIATVLQSFYTVPDYQREYVWEREQVEQLLSDINDEREDGGAGPEYFIGSIVVCAGPGGVLELIDGQQRMTTLYVALCAIRDRLKELGLDPPGALAKQVFDVSTDESGEDVQRYRLDLQYEDSGDVLERIAKGEARADLKAETRSTQNIMQAYDAALAYLHSTFEDDGAGVKQFYGYLSNKVKLIRIQTEDVTKALKVFETINDRGVGLDSMDLLKNLLFMKADRKQFDKLKDVWKTLQDTIHKAGEKPLRFLRYFIFSRYEVDRLREDEIYSWFTKNEALCGYKSKPLEFAKELVEAAKAYRQFMEGNDHRGNKNRYLQNIGILGGKAARQHLILLLAGRHLEGELFDRLAQEVENLFFAYVITREPTKVFERNFAAWAGPLRAVKDAAGLEAFIADRFTAAKRTLSDRFDDALKRLSTDALQKYRLQYVLAKLTQHVELQAYGETEGTRWLEKYTKSNYEIEHIYPQNPSEEAVKEFGEFKDPKTPQRLGNLVLAEKSINSSLGKKPYSQKRKVYPQSQLLLTRALAERPQVGSNTKIDTAVAGIEPFTEWNEANVQKRQEFLAKLARQVWAVPEL
ncbi:MAG: hypothetical protein ICCCNLDF_01360 [Planctomycetes bacterium]|nr:hypothetical protein [Planctomycetota bacterium]